MGVRIKSIPETLRYHSGGVFGGFQGCLQLGHRETPVSRKTTRLMVVLGPRVTLTRVCEGRYRHQNKWIKGDHPTLLSAGIDPLFLLRETRGEEGKITGNTNRFLFPFKYDRVSVSQRLNRHFKKL